MSKEAIEQYQTYLMDTFRDNRYTKFYALTVTPHIHSTTEYYLSNVMYDIINQCKSVISITYNYERSEAGKLHIHGIIATKDKTKFLKVKKHPIAQIHTTELNGETWIYYCTKSKPRIIHSLTRVYDVKHHIDPVIRHEQINLTW